MKMFNFANKNTPMKLIHIKFSSSVKKKLPARCTDIDRRKKTMTDNHA